MGRRAVYLLLAAGVLSACSTHIVQLVDGGGSTEAGTTSAGTSTAGTGTTAGMNPGNGTSSGASGSGGSSSGASGSGGSSTTGCAENTSTTGISTTGGVPVACNDDAGFWVGDVCSLRSCKNTTAESPCVLDGGGLGGCYGGNCLPIDLKNDPNNCGGYGVVCPPPARCQNSLCVGLDCTDGGGCASDRVCAVAGCVLVGCSQATDDSACAWDTLAPNFPGFCCGGTCLAPFDLTFQSDPMNCGGCGAQCPAGSICVRGGCFPAVECDANRGNDVCALPSGDAGFCCGGGCADLMTDPLNCSKCGFACPTGSACVLGQCVSACTDQNACPAGHGCLGGSCVLETCGPSDDYASCFDPDAGAYDASVPFNFCCAGSCIGLNDARNCGRCGQVCAAGEQCYSWGPGYESLSFCAQAQCGENGSTCFFANGRLGNCCSGQCVDLFSDPANCWICGLACPAGSLCNGPSGNYFCVTDAGDGVYCTLDSDCPAEDKCDVSGTCVPASCSGSGSACYLLPNVDDAGLEAVYGNCCNGICINTIADPSNCGVCGATCPLGSTCAGGSCFSADAGYDFDCSFLNCAPGSVCGVTADDSACFTNSCGGGTDGNPCLFKPVSGPWTWTGHGVGTCCGGACVATDSDPNNCLFCGMACASGPCISSRCVEAPSQNCLLSCAPGTICAGTECVGSNCTSNGLAYNPLIIESPYCLAEDGTVGTCCTSACANLNRDPQNCGTCGIVCPPGTSCENGLCNGLAACGPGHAGSLCDPDSGLSFRCCPGLGCIDTSSDPANCGDCGKTCTACQTCVAGSCM